MTCRLHGIFIATMPTVHQQTTKYCQKHNLPAPSPDDLSRIGNTISLYFRKSWGANQTKEIIGEARFVFSHERNCKPFIVIDYPESYGTEMNKIVSHFYHEKALKEKKDEAVPAVPKRTRKPVRKPEISVKPQEKIQ